MPHVLDIFAEQNLGNVVDNEQRTPISVRSPKETIEINIFRGGEQTSQAGVTRNFDESDLDQVCQTYDPELHLAPLIRGHDEVDDGAPSMGWVQSIIRKGLDLVAQVALTGFGKQQLEEGNFARVSCRFYPPEDRANPYPGQLSLRHLALVTIPAIKGLGMFSEREPDYPNTPLSSWDYVFGEELSYATLDEVETLYRERQEIKNALQQAMSQYNLDGEDPNAPQPPQKQKPQPQLQPDPDVEEMDMGEGVTIKALVNPELLDGEESPCAAEAEQPFNEEEEEDEDLALNLGTVGVPFRSFPEAGMLPGKQVIIIPDGFAERTSSQTHDSDAGRQKEYSKIIADTQKQIDDENLCDCDEADQKKHLLDSLLQHFSNQRARAKTPKLEIDGEQKSREQKGKPSYKSEDKNPSFKGTSGFKDKQPKSDFSETEDQVLIPPVRKNTTRLEQQSYSEAIAAKLSETEQKFQQKIWNDFAESLYRQGVLVDAVVPQTELVDALMFLDNQTSQLSFAENQVNPLDVFKKVLENLPQTVGLNGFEPVGSNANLNAQNLFTDPMIEPHANGLVYAEGNQNIAFSADSYALHQQALKMSKDKGIDYSVALSQIFNS